MSRSVRTVVVAASLLLSPSLASGQYMTPQRENNPFAGKPAPIAPVSVAKAILEREKGMNLTESQRLELAAVQRRLDSVAAPLLRQLDSLRPTWRPAGGANDLSPEQRERITANWNARSALVDSLTPVYAKAREQVMTVLDEDQRERAAKLEKDARKRAEQAAKRELQSGPQQYERPDRRRGRIQDATGRAPLD
jgi:hypothetical protein